VLRHGFKHRGIEFKVCYFRPESALNQTSVNLYSKNEITCNRQWFFSAETEQSVDMVIAINGIPVFAFELTNQYTGQSVKNAKRHMKMAVFIPSMFTACARPLKKSLFWMCWQTI